MASKVQKYDVVFPNGLRRQKQLSEEDAKALRDGGAKVTSASAPAAKQRQPGENKTASAAENK